ncbi:hypothetical protein [Methylobacterium sp. Leaf85]|uniref:hypothetical protein n=1 Tax=Methylobacterium sp. Leaf85 TaxID=1736241 RepID=UPI0012E7FBDA|nr:hypothetical protein [Methylobacterium sp. Leaf85]
MTQLNDGHGNTSAIPENGKIVGTSSGPLGNAIVVTKSTEVARMRVDRTGFRPTAIAASFGVGLNPGRKVLASFGIGHESRVFIGARSFA